MWKSNDMPCRRPLRQVLSCATAAAILLALPLAAAGGLDKRGGPAAAATAKPRPAAGQQLRCWQYGRLILEENGIAAPAESATYALRMHADDARRTPVLLVSSGSATCLIKGAAAAGKP